MVTKTSKQDSVTPPTERNPTGKGGFGDNPENRSDGRWKKEGSISYNYNMLMRLSEKDFKNFKPETVAQQIAFTRVKAAKDKKFGLPDTKEITDRTEGKAPQSLDITSKGKELNVALVEFVNSGKPNGKKDSNKAS